MMQGRKYMAGTVPRFLRQTRLGHLKLNCVIGSRLIVGSTGNNLYYDIIMLPAQEFARMKTNVGLQHMNAPVAQPGGASFAPGFVVTDAQEVTVPSNESDPDIFARLYFLEKFNLLVLERSSIEKNEPAPDLSHMSLFFRASQECTARKNFI
jgi:hypothetical protein